jgi:hypothetical protein
MDDSLGLNSNKNKKLLSDLQHISYHTDDLQLTDLHIDNLHIDN